MVWRTHAWRLERLGLQKHHPTEQGSNPSRYKDEVLQYFFFLLDLLLLLLFGCGAGAGESSPIVLPRSYIGKNRRGYVLSETVASWEFLQGGCMVIRCTAKFEAGAKLAHINIPGGC